jgi:hypothetical protein
VAECAVPRDRPPKCPDLTGGVESSRTLTPRTEVAWLLPQLADGEIALTDPLINYEWGKTYPAGSALPLGVIELALYVLYLVPKTRYLGGLLMLAYLGGSLATHVHANDGMFFVPVIIGVVAWLGLYLRDRRLRALVPLASD